MIQGIALTFGVALILLMILVFKDVGRILNERQTEKQNLIEYTKCYQAKYLLTKNEWHEHNKLRYLANQKGLIICPKVRLLDIIEPRAGERNYITLLRKVQSKHVDFVLCDQNMNIKAVLELDDSSHNRKDRQERDAFVDQILTSVGYTVIHTRAITETTLDVLNKPAAEPIEQT